MSKKVLTILQAQLLDEALEHDLADLCRYAQVSRNEINQMIDEGILEPRGCAPQDWRFSQRDFVRTRIVARLQHDLNVNLPGAAIIVELIEARRY